MRLAYLVSQYPAVNHTFILREVRQLRALGWELETISVRPCDREAHELTAEERDEHSRTTYLLSASLLEMLANHLTVFIRRPFAYLSTLFYAVRLGHVTPRRFVWNLFYFAEAVALDYVLARDRIEHVHAHFSSTVALLAGRLSGVPFSMTIHGPDEFVDPVGFSLERKIRSAKFIVAISNYARSQLMRYCDYDMWQKLEVSRLGVDPNLFRPTQKRGNSDVHHLICVGRLAPVKGQFILISALACLRQTEYRVRLSLVGDGPDRERLEQVVAELGLEDVVEFHGWLNQDQLQPLLATADVFVLASFAEGVPVVLMEAMAAGLPCVATRVNGVPELIQDGVDGLLVPPSSAADFASATARILDSEDLRQRLGLHARARVVEEYNLTRNSGELSNIFSGRLLGGTRPGPAPSVGSTAAQTD